jgi:hypothetical protein
VIRNKDIFLYDVPNHKEHKEEIINLIKQIPQNTYMNISHCDYNLPNSLMKAWNNYFIKNIYFLWKNKFCDLINSDLALSHSWFQWYEKNDFHDWHVHPGSHFTNVYYLNLPYKDMKTSIKDFDETKNIDISEGQIISFPGYWKHKSPPNIYNEPKIIVSFNTNLKDFGEN